MVCPSVLQICFQCQQLFTLYIHNPNSPWTWCSCDLQYDISLFIQCKNGYLFYSNTINGNNVSDVPNICFALIIGVTFPSIVSWMYIVLMVDTSNCSSNLRHATTQMTSNLTYRLIRAKFTHAYNVLKGGGGKRYIWLQQQRWRSEKYKSLTVYILLPTFQSINLWIVHCPILGFQTLTRL